MNQRKINGALILKLTELMEIQDLLVNDISHCTLF